MKIFKRKLAVILTLIICVQVFMLIDKKSSGELKLPSSFNTQTAMANIETIPAEIDHGQNYNDDASNTNLSKARMQNAAKIEAQKMLQSGDIDQLAKDMQEAGLIR